MAGVEKMTHEDASKRRRKRNENDLKTSTKADSKVLKNAEKKSLEKNSVNHKNDVKNGDAKKTNAKTKNSNKAIKVTENDDPEKVNNTTIKARNAKKTKNVEEVKESNVAEESTTDNAVGKRKRSASGDAAMEERLAKFSRKAPEIERDVTRSMPASGRWWKPVHKERFSMMQYRPQSTTLSTSWEKKMALRKQRQMRKEYDAEVKAAQEAAKEAAKQKRLEKMKRKAENEMKNARVQVITKTDKIKKMNKKQLKSVMKTQMDKDGNVHYVPIYSS